MSRMSSLTSQDHNVAGNNSPNFFQKPGVSVAVVRR